VIDELKLEGLIELAYTDAYHKLAEGKNRRPRDGMYWKGYRAGLYKALALAMGLKVLKEEAK
jgi:hypothetical protein